ncbi:hypothetical protein HDZ31DRAFT_62640 [Schizophyllum fasciatum]
MYPTHAHGTTPTRRATPDRYRHRSETPFDAPFLESRECHPRTPPPCDGNCPVPHAGCLVPDAAAGGFESYAGAFASYGPAPHASAPHGFTHYPEGFPERRTEQGDLYNAMRRGHWAGSPEPAGMGYGQYEYGQPEYGQPRLTARSSTPRASQYASSPASQYASSHVPQYAPSPASQYASSSASQYGPSPAPATPRSARSTPQSARSAPTTPKPASKSSSSKSKLAHDPAARPTQGGLRLPLSQSSPAVSPSRNSPRRALPLGATDLWQGTAWRDAKNHWGCRLCAHTCRTEVAIRQHLERVHGQ